jgi:hypothetical protein
MDAAMILSRQPPARRWPVGQRVVHAVQLKARTWTRTHVLEEGRKAPRPVRAPRSNLSQPAITYPHGWLSASIPAPVRVSWIRAPGDHARPRPVGGAVRHAVHPAVGQGVSVVEISSLLMSGTVSLAGPGPTLAVRDLARLDRQRPSVVTSPAAQRPAGAQLRGQHGTPVPVADPALALAQPRRRDLWPATVWRVGDAVLGPLDHEPLPESRPWLDRPRRRHVSYWQSGFGHGPYIITPQTERPVRSVPHSPTSGLHMQNTWTSRGVGSAGVAALSREMLGASVTMFSPSSS